jgi:hypothetical protein
MHRNSGLFWGALVLLAGILFLLSNFNILRGVNVWGLIWPAFLILAGLWVLLSLTRRGKADVDHVSLPLGERAQARIVVEHGFGVTSLSGAAEPGALVSGSFAGGLDYRLEGSQLRLKMADAGFPFNWFVPRDVTWDFRVSGQIPLELKFDGSAGQQNLNLRDLRVTTLKLDGGVGERRITMPARAGQTTAELDGGVGATVIDIPEGVAAEISVSAGLGGVTIPPRFPKVGEHLYRSADYNAAANRLSLKVDVGVGAVTIR